MSPTDPGRWHTLRPLLDELLELPAGEREAALDRLCGGDDGLRDELRTLLAADEAAERGSALERPADLIAQEWLREAGVERPTAAEADRWVGRTLGPYRIRRLLGEGGMGIVFEAEQDEPRRAVALKLVRGGAFLDDSRLRLFRREIEALARLQHPAIAPIHAAGRTDDGQHYFAMELVHGRPLDEYLRARLATAQDRSEREARLGLFLEVCDAIAYAHTRGVIHRDLKPSNVFVEDAGPATGSSGRRTRVKVLDFGLARITDGDVALSTHRSEPRAIEGTLPYMSPEQARGDAAAIDLRSDVYALGVLLYEMLTGERPYPIPRGALHEALRTILDAVPRRPSQVLPALRGDFDVILLKALEKDPSARYPNVFALADDVRRARDDQPIGARAPGTGEQLRRWARRHRTAAVFGAALATALVLGSVGTTVGMLRARAAEREARKLEAEAREEARTAESVSRYLVGLFEASDPDSAHPDAVAARRLLARGVQQLDSSLVDQPVVRGRLYQTLGLVHRNIGLYAQSRDLLTRAVEIRRATLGPRHLDVATSEYVLAGLLRRIGEYDEALQRYQTALDIRLAALGPDHRDVAGSYAGLANVHIERGEFATARPIAEKALATALRALGPEDPAVATYQYNLALLLRDLGDAHAARPLLERGLELQLRARGPEHPIVGDYRFVLGSVLARLGERDTAFAQMRRGLAIVAKGYGPEHAIVGESLGEFAAALQDAGLYEAARDTAARSAAVLTRAVGADYWRTAMARDQYALALRSLGRAREAVGISQASLRIIEAEFGATHEHTGAVVFHLAGHCEALGDTARARTLYARALPLLERKWGREHPDTRAAARGAATGSARGT